MNPKRKNMNTLTQKELIVKIAEIRNDIKFFNLVGVLPSYAKSIYELKEMADTVANELYELRNSFTNEIIEYKNEKKYNSEKSIIKLGLSYWDKRYSDFYTIENMQIVEGGDVDVTMKYSKGKTRTESGDFILYHLASNQHSIVNN